MLALPNLTQIHAVFASTSGNTEQVVETIQHRFISHNLNLVLHRAESTPFSVFEQNNLFLLATSTWEHGVINPLFNRLLKELSEHSLAGKSAVFVGCGDRRYEPVLFCEGLFELQRAFTTAGGTSLGEPLLIDGNIHPGLEQEITQWADTAAQELEEVLTP
jgi:flavodoxin